MTLIDAENGETIGEVIEFYDLPHGLLLEFRGPKGVHASLRRGVRGGGRRDARRIVVRLPDGLIEE
jgi:hypothetical protein